MENTLLTVALAKGCIYLPKNSTYSEEKSAINESTLLFTANLSQLGYTLSENLLRSIDGLNLNKKLAIWEALKELSGANKNWTPLVKQWDIPTQESIVDHWITMFANIFNNQKGSKLACGHIIPPNTFPLERYNGCPFCGTPFEFEKLANKAPKSKLKTLQLWNEDHLKEYLNDLIESPVALDASQVNDLEILIANFGITASQKPLIKETLMLVIDCLVKQGNPEKASLYFKTPNDILRYLWYKHTGFLQIVEPKTIAKRLRNNARNRHFSLDNSAEVKIQSKADLKLKFKRSECKQYATWLTNLDLGVKEQCESMHSKRGIWVRVIRALRLAEYSKQKGNEKLAKMLDAFYNEDYNVWQAEVNENKFKMDADKTLTLLKQRPGLFARSLFSSMLWFGPEITIQHFKEVMYDVPPRLILSLNMYAQVYFQANAQRVVKPLGGVSKKITGNALLELYSEADLKMMRNLVKSLSLELIRHKFSQTESVSKTIFIEDRLSEIPISIGDRSENIQDHGALPVGTRFKMKSNELRLFIQWGKGLKAQHLDMDLSCYVSYADRSEFCSYSQLNIPGCKHSGDIQYIPNLIGTAEYINIDLALLKKLGAKYVSFVCNAYTNGSLAPNLELGWMNSNFPMKISSQGVAYEPSAVEQKLRIKETLNKGLLFGILDIEKAEIIWLEMSFQGQVVQKLNFSSSESIAAHLAKLDAKLKIGELLRLKAEVQGLEIVSDRKEADEVYDSKWALNSAAVSKLII